MSTAGPIAAAALIIGSAALSAGAAAPPGRSPETIGDLARRSIEVHPDAVVSGGSAKAMEH